METDEKQIRKLVSTWIEASAAGDTQAVLSLMTDDVVFLTPGRAPMRKADFVAASASHVPVDKAPRLSAESSIQEILVVGDFAFMWTKLKVIATPQDGAAPIVREGNTLSVLRKENGRWLLARDANMLAKVG